MPTEQTLATTGLEVLCSRLQDAAGQLDAYETWPREQMEWCNEAGVLPMVHRRETWRTKLVRRKDH